jgi:hypothetical protein
VPKRIHAARNAQLTKKFNRFWGASNDSAPNKNFDFARAAVMGSEVRRLRKAERGWRRTVRELSAVSGVPGCGPL